MKHARSTIEELKETPNIKYIKNNSSKVDINDLLLKVRKQKNKEDKENYIFLGLICGVVAVTGVIASL
tara:strand:+ start:434 stop:637 length:204 start_codon:yes stop_codon:yes gene_type:complete